MEGGVRVGAGGGGTGEAPQRPSLWWIVLFAVPGALLAALAISAQTYLSMLGHGHSFRAIFAWQLCCWTIWALAAPAVVHAGTLLLESRRSRGATLLHIGALGVGLVVFHVTVTAQLTVWFQPYVPYMPASYREAFAAQSWALLPIDTLTFVLLVIIGWALAVHYRARYLEFRESRLEAELARAHLDALRLEIQPHFLFNTLNAIAEWCRQDGEVAERAVLELSSMLRATLDGVREEAWPLARELDLVRNLFDLHRMRDKDRFTLEEKISAELPPVRVPPMALLTLAENAMKHGPGAGNRGVVTLEVQREGAGTRLAIENPGRYAGPRAGSQGLPTLERRLRLAYDGHARLKVGPASDEQRTCAELWIPDQEAR